MARTPVAEVHAQVVRDLSAADSVLPATRSAADLGRATKGAAEMALADLYLWRSSFSGSGEWQQAADWAKQVIDAGVWGLNDDYLATFLPANKGNREMIFPIMSSAVEGRSSMNLGCLILPRVLGFGTGGGCEVIGQPTRWFYDSYTPGDYRKEVSFRTSGCSTSSTVGCVTFNWPNVYKYRPTNGGVSAEAQNELGNATEAVRYLNMIRARARKGTGAESRPAPADYAGPMDQASVRDAIYAERNWEFAVEAKRWFDLVRRERLVPGSWESALRQHHDSATVARSDLRAHKMRWPIPRTELDLNRALTQNPGY